MMGKSTNENGRKHKWRASDKDKQNAFYALMCMCMCFQKRKPQHTVTQYKSMCIWQIIIVNYFQLIFCAKLFSVFLELQTHRAGESLFVGNRKRKIFSWQFWSDKAKTHLKDLILQAKTKVVVEMCIWILHHCGYFHWKNGCFYFKKWIFLCLDAPKNAKK